MSRTVVGVVGLGLMGSNMAKHLIDEGYTVIGYDTDEAKLSSAAEYGATTADSASEVANQADILISSLPNPDIVDAAYTADDGVFAGVEDELVVLEMSTSTPSTTRSLADRAPDGVDMVDSPVDGGPENCRDGTLVILNGGEQDVIERDPAKSVLDALSAKRFYAGGLGAGHTLKLLNNTMAIGNLQLGMEVVAVGIEAGVDGERMIEILTNMGGSSKQLEKRLPRVLNRNFEPGFTIDLAKKDLGLAVEAANDQNAPVPGSSYVHQMMVRASAEGYGSEDMAAMAKLFEDAISKSIEANTEVDESFGGY